METLKRGKMRKWTILMTVVLGLGLSTTMLVSCDAGGGLISGETAKEQEISTGNLIAPNIVLQVSYNQKAMTFSRFWPEELVTAGNSMQRIAVDGGQELLVAYENTQQIEAFDNQRYFYTDTRYLEGNDAINMPEAMFQELSGEMPDRSDDKVAVNRIKLANGTMTSWGIDGSVKTESVSMDSLRMDSDAYNNMVDEFETYGYLSVEEKIQQNLEHMQETGINFKELGGDYISYELDDDPTEGEDDIGVIKQVLDLKTGEVVLSAILLKDGRYDSITFMDYETHNGLNVMANSETLQYGMQNGEWSVIQRSLINRTNIDVQLNL
jgi:hypothetical protein